MKKKYIIALILVIILAPLVEVVILYRLAMTTGLPGRKGGPQDAFRHTYSTALTARYISPRVVEFVTWAAERNPNSPFDRMDIHNNRIGTNLGRGKDPIYETVLQKIKNGQINAQDIEVVTWLPENNWDMSGF